METAWNEGNEIDCALCIGDISDAEGKRTAVIAVTVFRVGRSVKTDGESKWFLEPLELCLVEDVDHDLKFDVVWQNDDIKPDEMKASKQKAFMKMVAGFGPDAKIESYGGLVSDFFENRPIELKKDMIDDVIMDFDAPTSMLRQDKEHGAMRPMQYTYEFISERPRTEKGIWQFVATDASKKDEDERLQQMEHIIRMGQRILDNGKKTGPKKSFSQLN